MSDNVEKVLQRVIEYCESVLALEERHDDERIKACEEVLKIIRKELESK